MAYKFEIFKDSAGSYRWRFKAANGEIVAQSEGYTSKSSAEHGMSVLKQYAAGATIEDLAKAAAGYSRW